MNPQNFTLTPRNTAALREYAELVGMAPNEFLNAFLAEFLVNRFGDSHSGNAEPFLLGFTFKDWITAERVAAWIKERITVPGSRETTEVEVFELPRGGFKVRAAWIGDGTMREIGP
jgi:hypothetical protein